jgi:hypothetical protein
MNKYSNEQVLYFISLIRGDVSNINKITKKPYETTKEINQIIFTKGDCFRFGQIMKFVYPEAHCLLVWIRCKNKSNVSGTHIVVELENVYYDINGEYELSLFDEVDDFDYNTFNYKPCSWRILQSFYDKKDNI